MPRKRKDIDKDEDRVPFKAGGQEFTGTLDKKSLREMYNAWEKEASGLEGETIGSVTGISLFQLIKNQGISGRLRGSGPKMPNKGGVEIFKELEKIFNAKEFSPEQESFLQQLDKMMDTYSGSEHRLNPANIRFDNPLYFDEKGRTTEAKEIYGHYRTDEYEDAQKVKGRDRPAVPDSWYNENMGQAKPPMWQALYGNKTENDKFTGLSLHQVVKQALKNFDEMVLEITKENPLDLTRRQLGTPQVAKLMLTIKPVRAIVQTFVNQAKSKPQKTFPAKSCRTALMANPMDLSNRDADAVKAILGIRGMKQDIEEIWVKISWRQCNNMAKILLGDNAHWTTAGKDALRVGKKPKPEAKPKPEETEQPKNDDTEKKSLDVETDWRMIVKC